MSSASFKVTEVVTTLRGKTFLLKIMKRIQALLFTWHAIDTLNEYGLTPEDVVRVLVAPDEIVRGHGERYVAHKKLSEEYLLRVVYEYAEGIRTIVTVYISSMDRYFRGGGIFEDKVLS